jgi:hypothetical protein
MKMAAAMSMECGDFLEFQVIIMLFNFKLKSHGANFTSQLCY